MSQNINKPEDFYRFIALVTPLMLGLLALHYWKPSCYWNSPQTTNLRNLIGDRAVDVLGYAVVILYYLLIFKVWLSHPEFYKDFIKKY